jgi:dihydrofolate synthase/folylpolyglutamate synthase
LGETIEKIAEEKCGIIKPNGTTVLYPEQQCEVFSIVRRNCKLKNNKLLIANLSNIRVTKQDKSGTALTLDGTNFHLPLLGMHQVKNLSVVLAVLDELKSLNWKIIEEAKTALADIKIPARLEVFPHNPLIILDGAHNPGGIEALTEAIRDYFPEKRILGIVGMLSNKDWKLCLQKICPFMEKIIATKPKKANACPPKLIEDHVRSLGLEAFVAKDSAAALKMALANSSSYDAIIIFGSLYLASEIRPRLLNLDLVYK